MTTPREDAIAARVAAAFDGWTLESGVTLREAVLAALAAESRPDPVRQDVRDCECVPGHRCDCEDLRSHLRRILTSAEYPKMEAEGLAAKALGLSWVESEDRYLPDPAVAESRPDPVTHGPEGNEGYCRCGYFGGGREHRDLDDHLAALAPADPTGDCGYECPYTREAHEQGIADHAWVAPADPTADLRAAEKPPTPWATIDKVSREWGLYDVVSRALLGKFTPSRRQLLVGNIVMAVAKWRENFRDCGCWKTDDGYALCPWHERMLQSQVGPLRAALASPTTTEDGSWSGPQTEAGRELVRDIAYLPTDVVLAIEREAVAAFLASPETAEALARAIDDMLQVTGRVEREDAPALLAALRKQGR